MITHSLGARLHLYLLLLVAIVCPLSTSHAQTVNPNQIISPWTIPFTITGNLTATAGQNNITTANFENAASGSFANTQMNLYSQSLLNSCNPQTELQRVAGAGVYDTEAITGCVAIPNGTGVSQATAVSGYSNTKQAYGSGVGGAVSFYGLSWCLVDGCQVWSANFNSEDDGSRTTGVVQHGIEVDVGEQSPSSAYSSLYGINTIIQGNGSGNVANSWAYVAGTRATGTHQWNIGFWSSSNAANTAFVSGPACFSGTCNSQGMRFDAFNSSSLVSSSIGSDSSGNLQVTPASGHNINLFGGGLAFQEGSSTRSASGFDTCYGDSTLHALKCSYNNGSYFQIPQVIRATSSAFATATTAGTCVQNTTSVSGATTSMVVSISPVSTPGVGAVWSAFVSSAGNVTINECAVATSAGGTIAFNIAVTP